MELAGNKENFFAEKSNTFLGKPLHSVGYVKLNIRSGRRHQKYEQYSLSLATATY